MAFVEQAEKCQTRSLLVISVCGKVTHKAPLSSMCEPERLILLKVVLEMTSSAHKSRENHPAFQQGSEKQPSLLLQLLLTPLSPKTP